MRTEEKQKERRCVEYEWLAEKAHLHQMSHRPTKPSSPWKTLSFYFFPFDLTPHLLFLHLFPPFIETLSLIGFQNPHHVAGLFSFPSCVQRKIKRYLIEIVTDRSLTVKMLILSLAKKRVGCFGQHNSLLLNMSIKILVKVTVFSLKWIM